MLYIPRVKICCIKSIDEAAMAVRYGASAIGLVSEMPSGPGPIPESLITEIASIVPPGVATFLLTSLTDTREVIEQQRRCRTNTIQLTDRLEIGTHADLRASLPGIHIVQVIHVVGEHVIGEAKEIASEVDAILLDTGNPGLPKKELGGTGRTHDWDISRRIRESVSVPLILGGGLREENVVEAIRTVKPYAVDTCSGVRTDGDLDEKRLAGFLEKVRSICGNEPQPLPPS
ncbi:MAG: phosphoribosylanthranilate isomerase [Deltaproteobacteria bacterium]|nr:MAG: phosphoribosylanthranilate isomerase [Deltaproteobacteria bacterium]